MAHNIVIGLLPIPVGGWWVWYPYNIHITPIAPGGVMGLLPQPQGIGGSRISDRGRIKSCRRGAVLASLGRATLRDTIDLPGSTVIISGGAKRRSGGGASAPLPPGSAYAPGWGAGEGGSYLDGYTLSESRVADSSVDPGRFHLIPRSLTKLLYPCLKSSKLYTMPKLFVPRLSIFTVHEVKGNRSTGK